MFDEIIYIDRIENTTQFVVSEFGSLLKINTYNLVRTMRSYLNTFSVDFVQI